MASDIKDTTDTYQYLKTITRKMLQKIARVLDSDLPESEEGMIRIIQSHTMIFGPKSSLVSALVSLSGLMIQLEKAGNGAVDAPITESDIALIDAFIHSRKLSSPIADITLV